MTPTLVCVVTPAATPTPDAMVSFAGDVVPLFAAYGCQGCHGGAAINSAYNVTTHGGVLGPGTQAKDIGQCDVIRNAGAGSYLVRKLEGAPGIVGDRMPQGGPFMTAAEVATIRRWIDQGAPDN